MLRKINFGARDTDLERLELIKAIYPNPGNNTEAIRLAIADYIKNADPVALEQARRAVAKRGREKAK